MVARCGGLEPPVARLISSARLIFFFGVFQMASDGPIPALLTEMLKGTGALGGQWKSFTVLKPFQAQLDTPKRSRVHDGFKRQ